LMVATINRGKAILRDPYVNCSHKSKSIQHKRLENPQQFLDESLSSVVNDVPLIVDEIHRLARERAGVQNGQR